MEVREQVEVVVMTRHTAGLGQLAALVLEPHLFFWLLSAHLVIRNI
jgi:hypothetical protein